MVKNGEKYIISHPLSLSRSLSLSFFPQDNDTDSSGCAEKAESGLYSNSYTSGATLGAELRMGRSRRLASSLQVKTVERVEEYE